MSTHLLQISAGTGPLEVRRFVAMLLPTLIEELQARAIPVAGQLLHGDEQRPHSAGIMLDDPTSPLGDLLGTHCLIAANPQRTRKSRKRWFASVSLHNLPAGPLPIRPDDLRFTTCRAGGPGGQHVQTSDSAVRVLHLPTGLAVRVEDQRSQHANRKVAVQRLAAALALRSEVDTANQRRLTWRAHHLLLRGAPVRTWRLSLKGPGLRPS